MATKPDALRMLAEDIAGFTHDPLGYAVYSFPWGERGALSESKGPRDWQCDVMEDVREHLSDPQTRFQPLRIAVASGHGIGKALAHGEPVLTLHGWKPVEEIRPADQVIAEDGTATRVLGVYPQGDRELFRVQLDDGCSVVVDGDHQWLTHSRCERKHGKPPSVRTTREIADTLTFRNGPADGLNHQLPRLEAVQHPRAALPIEPYLFGCWLGDGDAKGRVTSQEDGFVALAAAGASMGTPVRGSGKAHCRSMLGIRPGLRTLGLFGCRSHEKSIPRCYLHGSVEQRTALLQGLLDTDGSTNGHGAVTFEITAPKLADDAAELVRSLGGVVRRSEKWGGYNGKRCRRVYRLFISLPREIAPFRLPRKAARYNPLWGTKNCERTRRRHIAAVEPVGRGHATCIRVQHPSHLFVTRDHIVTHNSALIGMLVSWGMDTCEDTRVVVTANTEPQIRTKLWPEIIKWRNMTLTAGWWKVTKTGIFSAIPGHEESWRADAVTWSEHNTEAFAGLHNKGKRILVITDESSKIADKVWEVIEGALTDEETEIVWLAFGNPTQNTGRFRECFGKHRTLWKTRQIDSRDVEGTNKVYLQSIIDTYGEDSDIAKVRVLGQFPSASSMQFIPSTIVEAARVRDVFSDPQEPLMMGVDVARFGDDRTTIYFRRGKDARSIPPIKLSQVDTMQLVGRIAEEHRMRRAMFICVDEGGIGAGVVDRLRQMQLPVVGVQFGAKPLGAVKLGEGVRVANRRAEMWAIMREWLQAGMIPDDQELADDLIGVEYGFNARDEILLEKKEHMKERGLASPDDGDGLALTFAVPAYPSFEEESVFDEFDDSGRSEVGGY